MARHDRLNFDNRINHETWRDYRGLPGHLGYRSTRCRIFESMPRQLALEQAPGFRVNGLAPTAANNARNLKYDPGFPQKWDAVTPARRCAEGEGYVGPCVFLASPEGGFVFGQVPYVDGGWTLQGQAPEMGDFDFRADRK